MIGGEGRDNNRIAKEYCSFLSKKTIKYLVFITFVANNLISRFSTMKLFAKTFGIMLLLVATTVQAETDAADYFTNRPFGWATCSDADGTPYVVDGGFRNANPKTIVLYSSGGDDRQTVMDAISQNDIIILDGSKGDFIFPKNINMGEMKNKTIVGRNGARLCTEWYVTPELKQVLVDANLDKYSTSSGTGGTLSNGVKVAEERELHTRQTIIDYLGDDSENYRHAGIFTLNSANENLVFRNLTLVGPGSVDIGGGDLVSNNGATHVWIDHCDFIDGLDGNLDSGYREGNDQFVTYSWNVFRYTDRSYSHPYSNGTMWDRGFLQYVTYSYNIWGAGCTDRLPAAKSVSLHMANNYYDCAGNNAAISVGENTRALIEGNYAEKGVKNVFKTRAGSGLYYQTRGNYGFGNYNDTGNTDISLEVPYEYPLVPVADVPAVLQGKHGAGATIDDLIDAYLANPTGPMTAPATYYSRRMVESHGKAWSADKKWDYVSGLVTKSLLKCTTQYPEDGWSLTAYDWCKYYADEALNDDGSFKAFKKGNIDNIASGKVFFELYHRELAKGTDEGKANASKYKVAADYLYNYLRYEYSRIQLEDGKNGFFHKDIYPNQMWLDGLYMGAAFYAEYLANFAPEDTEGWADIANQFITIHKHTYDPAKKLNYHGWSADPKDSNSFWANRDGEFKGCSSEFWGRGMGWFFAALVDVLEVMPKIHANYAEVKGILAQVAEGLKQWQDAESGVWYQLLQYDASFVGECGKSNYLEASASCMFTYSYLKALRLGLIDESYRAVAEKAYAGVLKTFVSENSDKSLNLNFSCKSAGLGPAKSPQRDGSASYYLCGSDVTMVSNEGKSIGPFIMASLEWERVCGGHEDVLPEEPETPDTPDEPEVSDTPDVPEFPTDVSYKSITEDWVFLTTADNIASFASENWIRGGETSSTKGGTIDPATGQTVDKYSGGGILLKLGNSTKALETYVTGVKEVTAYACTAGSSDRTLIVTATPTEGETLQAKATSLDYTSVGVTLSLEGSECYRIDYTGTEAADENSGGDMVLHGIRFVADDGTAAVGEAFSESSRSVEVYTLQGVLLGDQIAVGDIEHSFPNGIYLINGKKLLVK